MLKWLGLSIFYLYTLYIDQHIKTYNGIQFTNGKPFNCLKLCFAIIVLTRRITLIGRESLANVKGCIKRGSSLAATSFGVNLNVFFL